MTGPDINKFLNPFKIILLYRKSFKNTINKLLLILGVDRSTIDEIVVDDIESIGDFARDDERYLVVEMIGSGDEWVDGFWDGLWGDEGFVDFGLFSAE